MGSEGFHESESRLSEDVMDRHRAIASIMEELEAVDWYDQRVSATGDEALAAVLAHNRDEEKEHAAMTIEWLRRNDATFAEQLSTYLFTDAPITEVEVIAMGGDTRRADTGGDEPAPDVPPAAADGHGLGIGSLRNHNPLEGS